MDRRMTGNATGTSAMLGRRRGDYNPGRFWRWFSGEAQGLANTIEALARGESDAERQLITLNDRIRRYDATMDADVVRTLDGACCLTVSGGSDHSLVALLNAAPALRGWRVAPRTSVADLRRVPFRLTPRPSLDETAPIEGLHQAWA